MTLSLFLSLGVHSTEQPSSPRVPSPPPLFSTFESAERAFVVRLEQPESKPPCGSRQRLPHPSRNEQRAISLLLNACHKSPRAPSTPPMPSPRATLPSPLHPSFSSQRSSHPSRRIRTHHSRSFPSSPPPRYTRFFSLPRPRRTPFLLFWTRLEEVSAWRREGRGGEEHTGTRNVHFCGSRSV